MGDASLSAVELNVYGGASQPYTTGLSNVPPSDMGDDGTGTAVLENLARHAKNELLSSEVPIRESEHASHGEQNVTLGIALVVLMAVLSGICLIFCTAGLLLCFRADDNI